MYIVPSSFNLAKSCELITTTVIGGLGSLTGSVLGAVIVTLLPEIFRSMANYRMLLYGIAVVLIMKNPRLRRGACFAGRYCSALPASHAHFPARSQSMFPIA